MLRKLKLLSLNPEEKNMKVLPNLNFISKDFTLLIMLNILVSKSMKTSIGNIMLMMYQLNYLGRILFSLKKGTMSIQKY